MACLILDTEDTTMNKTNKQLPLWSVCSHRENYKTLKDIKESLNKWRNIPCSWTGKLNIKKVCIFPNSVRIFAKPSQPKRGKYQWNNKEILEADTGVCVHVCVCACVRYNLMCNRGGIISQWGKDGELST